MVAAPFIVPSTVLALAAGLGIAYFLFVAVNPKLYLVPRYLIVVAWCASIIVAWWLANLGPATGASLPSSSRWPYLLVSSRFRSKIRIRASRSANYFSVGRKAPESAFVHGSRNRRSGARLFPFSRPIHGRRPYPGPRRAQRFFTAPIESAVRGMSRCKNRAADFKPTPRWISVQSGSAAKPSAG